MFFCLLLLILLQLEVVGKSKLYRMTDYVKLCILSKYIIFYFWIFFLFQVNYKRKPTRTLCDKCDSLVYTEVEGKAGCGAWAWSVACCVIGYFLKKEIMGKSWLLHFLFNSRLVFGCCLLPFCCRRCRVYKHRCPQCGAEMAKYAGALNSRIILLYFV